MDHQPAPKPDTPPASAANPSPGGGGAAASRPFSLPAGYLEYYAAQMPASTGTGSGGSGSGSGGGSAPVQRRQTLAAALSPETTHEVAARGVSGAGGALPFAAQIQTSFGAHDVSDIRAHTGGEAQAANQAIGARAYATGRDVAFAGAPDLHTAAHEAAHVVQQRGGVHLKGGVGEAGDSYERHADAVAERVVQGGSAAALLDQVAAPGARASGSVQRLQLALDGDLRTAAQATPFDATAAINLINAAPIAEVTAVAGNAALIRQVEAKMPAAQRDSVRARLARRLFIDGHQPLQAWALITGDDRIRRQRYLDAYGTTAEQRTFEDGVIADGTNTGYMIRAFDSYWDVEASRQAGARWNAGVIQRMHTQLKLLPDRDVRAQDTSGRVWRTIVLSVAPEYIDRAAFGSGEFTVGAHAGVGFQDQAGYGTKLTAAAAAGATTLQVNEGNRLSVGDTFAIGTGNTTHSADPNYDRGTVTAIAGNTLTINPALAHAHRVDDMVTRVDATGGSSKLTAAAAVGATTLQINDGTRFSVNDGFGIGTGASTVASDPNYDQGTVTAIAGNMITITPAVTHAHRVDDVVTRRVATGNNSALTAAAAVGATTLTVGAGSSFAVNDRVALGTGANTTTADPNFDAGRIASIAGNVLTLQSALGHAHAIGDRVARVEEQGSGARNINWLSATVRHEIAHAVDASIPSVVQGFTVGQGGWWTSSEPATEADFDTWVGVMGTATAWTGATSGTAPATTPITPADKALVKTTITNAVANKSGSLFALGLAASHPIMRNRANNVPVIVAAEACLSRGDGFYNNPEAIYATGGKCFSVSNWYRKFMYHNESLRTQRLTNYTLYAPAEFFAETYTVFYEEAGRPGVTEADYGRLVGNGSWREWMRTNVHSRGLAPAGTTPAPTASPAGGGGGGGGGAGAGGGGPAGGGAPGGGAAGGGGAQPGGGTGRRAHRSGP